MIGYGLGAWAITPAQQKRLLGASSSASSRVYSNSAENPSARGHVRSGDHSRILLSLNASALYAGVCLGGAVGGLTLALGRSVAILCWTAAGIELLALAVLALSARARSAGRRRFGGWRWYA